jgi:myo-inositol-1(or 4)-monophosphatase
MSAHEAGGGRLRELLAVAREAVSSASSVIPACGREHRLEYKSSPTDVRTAADYNSEAAVVSVISRRRPYDGLITEERGEMRPSGSGLRWLVDPLDGTNNFVRGIPHFCVSVGCEEWSNEEGWGSVVGVVFDVCRRETFWATLGGGSRLNGKALRVNDPVSPSRAVVGTEFAFRAADRRRQGALVASMAADLGDVRSSGSSALDLCWIACGRLDGYWEDELGQWDRAAASLVVTEAGGVVSPLGTGVVAGGAELHRWLVGRVSQFYEVRDDAS